MKAPLVEGISRIAKVKTVAAMAATAGPRMPMDQAIAAGGINQIRYWGERTGDASRRASTATRVAGPSAIASRFVSVRTRVTHDQANAVRPRKPTIKATLAYGGMTPI